MELGGDRDRTILAMLIARAWRDPEYLQRLRTEPKAVLSEEGVELPDGVDVTVLEDTDTVKYVGISRDTQEADPNKYAKLLEALLPIAAGHEVRLVQSTDDMRYIVLPALPAGTDPSSMSEPDLMRLAADDSTATSTNVAQTAEAVTTEAAVAETTEAVNAETTTDVVAEAELVAT
jgi:nitrile hydratase